MRNGYVRLTFRDYGDGTGTLRVAAESKGFSGQSGAWFGVPEIEEFAARLRAFPLPSDARISLSGGFGTDNRLDQEHIGIEVYPVDDRGHIGIQVRVATELWGQKRPQSQMAARLEVITSYQPLLEFSQHLSALTKGELDEVLLEGEAFYDP